MSRILPIAFLFLALALFLATAPLLRAGGDLTPDQFKAVTAKAQDMDHTTIGMSYEDEFTKDIGDRMRDAIRSCARQPVEIDLVFVIAANGKVERVFADPTQPVAGCVAGKLSRERLSPPPHGEWLQLVNIYVRP